MVRMGMVAVTVFTLFAWTPLRYERRISRHPRWPPISGR